MTTITIPFIINQLEQNSITDKLEQAHFLAQVDHESGGFTRLSENLNYSAEALLKMFPTRFTADTAKLYGRTSDHPANQQKVANILYGSRMGNEKDGVNDNDGWDYRGGGLIQLTGKDNYLGFMNWLHRRGKNLNLTIDSIGDFIKSSEGAILSAIYFWQSRGIGKYAREGDTIKVSKLINGGTNGLEERKRLTIKYKNLLGINK